MRGLSRLLLGGALGALVGMLILQKRGKRVTAPADLRVKPSAGPVAGGPAFSSGVAVPEPEPLVEAETEEMAEPELVSVPEPVTEPQPEPELELQPEPALVIESEPAPAAEAETVPEVEPEPVVEEQATALGAEPELVAEEEPAAELEAVTELETTASEQRPRTIDSLDDIIGDDADYEPSGVDLGSGFDVVVAPDILDQPLPGAGWESSLVPLADEEMEEIYPVPSVHAPIESEIAPFLEYPQAAEEQAAEEQAAPEEVPAAYEQPAVDAAPVPEERPLNGGPGSAGPALAGISADDLRARIEATRRRIRKELDEPFVGGTPGVPTESSGTPDAGSEEPPILQAVVMEPIESAQALPSAQELSSTFAPPSEEMFALPGEIGTVGDDETGPVPEDVPSPVTEPQEGTAEASGRDEDALGVDYSAMKARIEQTRGRLKAKAFDALMTGESALLGRDDPGKGVERQNLTVLDDELDETIETGLREEED